MFSTDPFFFSEYFPPACGWKLWVERTGCVFVVKAEQIPQDCVLLPRPCCHVPEITAEQSLHTGTLGCCRDGQWRGGSKKEPKKWAFHTCGKPVPRNVIAEPGHVLRGGWALARQRRLASS